MTRAGALQHICAALAAVFLVFGLRVQDFNLQGLIPTPPDWLRVYTPYFPGLNNLDQHEIFSHRYDQTKKIVFLGASSVDSVGCDGTWSYPDTRRIIQHNADATCSIAGQVNSILAAEGVKDWRAFDLARAGASLTPMLYVYARLRQLKPEIVIYGDTLPYYMNDNADAARLSASQYAELDAMFGGDPATRPTWAAYRQTLRAHGWQPPAALPASRAAPATPANAVTLHDLLYGALVNVRRLYHKDGPPEPIEIGRFRDWKTPHDEAKPIQDPGFGYFQGVTLIGRAQKEDGHALFFYLSPEFDKRADVAYQHAVDGEFGGYLQRADIPYLDLIAMPLTLNVETYDGLHQTVYGNRRIAVQLLQSLRRQGLIGAG